MKKGLAMALPANDNNPAEHSPLPRQRQDVLPVSLPPRGLSRVEAAAYIGVSPSLFDQLVQDGRMPVPLRVNTRTIWDRRRLDLAFDALLTDGSKLTEDWTVAV
jgi:hypothetical protein